MNSLEYVNVPKRGRVSVNFALRHGPKERNVGEGREVPLTPQGEKDARAHAIKIRNFIGLQRIGAITLQYSQTIRAKNTTSLVFDGLSAAENILTRTQESEYLNQSAQNWGVSDYGKEFEQIRLVGLNSDLNPPELMIWMLEKSDMTKLRLGSTDPNDETFSEIASRIATLTLDLLDEHKQDKDKSNLALNILCTHCSVMECFLAKVIEFTKDHEEALRFMKSIGRGFDCLEGLKIIFDTDREGQTGVSVWFGNKDFRFFEKVPVEILQEIKSGFTGSKLEELRKNNY